MRKAPACVLGWALLSHAVVITGAPEPPLRAVQEKPQDTQQLARRLIAEQVALQLLGRLPPDERRLFASMPVTVVLDADPLLVGVVNGKGGLHEVQIGTGFVVTIEVASDASAVAAKTLRYRDLIGFARDYATVVRESMAKPGTVDLTAPARMFAARIRWDGGRYEAFRATSEYQSIRSSLTAQSLAWVVAHYMGHAVLDARTRQADAIEDERAADVFAADLTRRAGFEPRPSLVSTALFAWLEDPEEDAPAGSLCRVVEIMRANSRFAQDPGGLARGGEMTLMTQYLIGEAAEVERIRSATRCPTGRGAARPMVNRKLPVDPVTDAST